MNLQIFFQGGNNVRQSNITNVAQQKEENRFGEFT